MLKTQKKIVTSVVAMLAINSAVLAQDYTNTSYYVAYDSSDNTQYALVMPSVNKVYTHKAGDIQNLSQVDDQLASFPTYNNGELCFPVLKSGAAGTNGTSIMAGNCYDVNYFYTQKETTSSGTAFMLYFKPSNIVYEGLAGQSSSFKVVKNGDTVNNSNSLTGDDYSAYSFNLNTATATLDEPVTQKASETLPNEITSDMTLTSDKNWILDGLVVVKAPAVLTIEPGTTIAGLDGTGDSTSYMIVDKGAKIMAEGTEANPIVFTSTKTVIEGEAPAVGQWGGLTIIGNAGNDQVQPYEVNDAFVAGTSDLADNSGVLKYVKILNSGITMAQDKEINGLSMVGVGSGTTVENITVAKSDDDCVELWGGTVNLTNVDLTECTDDHFDIDDGYSGTVKNLTITQTTGNAAIEMSGTTSATFDGFNIVQNASAKEGGIFFKKDGIGGIFKNGVITDNVDDANGAFHSESADGVSDTVDAANTSFENVTINGSTTGDQFTGTSAATLESIYSPAPKASETLPNEITSDMTLTSDKNWILDGLVVVKAPAVLTIEPGTTIAGLDGTGDSTSYMIVDKGAKIMAEGTEANPIVFTSTKTVIEGEAPAVGQWGGLTIIGNAGNDQVQPYEVNDAFVAGTSDLADNSGVLKYVKILNSGITMAQDKEINGLSMVGVGSGTTVENITVAKSDDDCVELWGGTVNLTNVDLTECTDDHFDIDDGYSGTVKNLTITQTTGNAAIEMSGTTSATFDGFNIVQNASAKEGGIFFKKDGIGGIFKNGVITDNVDDANGAFHSESADGVSDTVDAANTSFENVTINGSTTGDQFTGTSAATLETKFDAGIDNSK